MSKPASMKGRYVDKRKDLFFEMFLIVISDGSHHACFLTGHAHLFRYYSYYLKLSRPLLSPLHSLRISKGRDSRSLNMSSNEIEWQ